MDLKVWRLLRGHVGISEVPHYVGFSFLFSLFLPPSILLI